MKTILLMGNPNVGKSVVFSRLTGVKVITSNYPGTTVEFTRGIMHIDHEDVEVIDVPGTYTLEPTSKAEEVAVKMLDETFTKEKYENVVINIIDATNLERNLSLTLQLIKRRIPVIAALNLWDETKHTGVKIDIVKLEQILKIPCAPTCAVTGEGIKQLIDRVKDVNIYVNINVKISDFDYDEKEKWHCIGDIITEVQKVTHRHHTFLEKVGDLSVNPIGGIPIALGVLFITFQVIRFIGEWLIGNVGEPIFENLWAPLMLKVSGLLGSKGVVHDIIIGKLVEGEIDFGESFGILTTGLFVPFAAVLPYVFAFYLVLSLLEDFGYLPRLAVLVDNVMHKLGVHGFAIIPFMLGLGCNVPGALSTRVMETRRERFIATTLMAIAVPCMAQIAMVVGLIGKHGAKGLGIVFGTLFIVWIVLGILMNKVMKGHAPELFMEIPPYRLPYIGALLKKVWMRIVWFIREAVPWVLFGVFLVNMLYTLRIIEFLGKIVQPIVSGILGLPVEAVGALVIGFLRKDVAVGMLAPLHLTLKQLIIASVVLTMYFPCAATFAVLIKEFGIKDMLKSTLIMICSTLLVAGLLNLIL
ncbi:MAG: ferrous iron transporter B [Elusimicrobia bacterium CG1_02_37_114]|nr:MAG: ferrous iron transporter B [Elusimicrobia bacterium CG1_02_37_114]PIV53423.1 MAG: ferrous iron transporter B [Elusimicrobia bacterium CG02_land_8_20_14_3_00_37_13]PIZ13059.1 MAG: ferrous iron transporter B [Elusimicrobia bacterium CG_4_10_14_0_8_um_filter_37_32]